MHCTRTDVEVSFHKGGVSNQHINVVHVILTSTAFRFARDADCRHRKNIVSSWTTAWLLLFLSLHFEAHFDYYHKADSINKCK
jgi:hypothetical protein